MSENDTDGERDPGSSGPMPQASDEQVINCMFDWEARKLARHLLDRIEFTESRVCHVDRQITIQGPRVLQADELRALADDLGVRHVELDGTPLVWEH